MVQENTKSFTIVMRESMYPDFINFMSESLKNSEYGHFSIGEKYAKEGNIFLYKKETGGLKEQNTQVNLFVQLMENKNK